MYGRIDIARDKYESYLVSIKGALAKPKIIICT